MARVDPKMLSEIQRKIDALSRGFGSRDTKTPLRNFINLFVDKIREDKSAVHIDSLIEAFRQYLTTQDVERRFTALIFLLAFLQQLGSSGKVNCHRFVDGLEKDLAPEMTNAYTDYNSELASDLDFENRKFKYNVCAMSMVIIERIFVLCATKFNFNKDREIRQFESMADKLVPSTRAQELIAGYSQMDFAFLDNDTNYLEEGPRVSEANLRKSMASLGPADIHVNPSGFFSQSGVRQDGLRGELAKVQKIREGILRGLKIPPAESDIAQLDEHIEQYKDACANLLSKMNASPGAMDEATTALAVKEFDFSEFLVVDLPGFFEKNLSNLNETIREIQRGHNRIFGDSPNPFRSGAESQMAPRSSLHRSNPFAADLNASQNRSMTHQSRSNMVEPISDFDKFGAESWVEGDGFSKPSGKSMGFASKAFDDFPGVEVPQKSAYGAKNADTEFKKPKNFGNLFEEEEEDPFKREANFEDFADAEDAHRLDQFLQKATNSNNPRGETGAKKGFGDLFGAKSEYLDQPLPESHRGIQRFEDFGNLSANKSGSMYKDQAFGGAQGFGKLPFVSQVSGIKPNTPANVAIAKKATFSDIFEGPVRQTASLSPINASLTRSQLNQRSPISSNLTFKDTPGHRESIGSNKKPQAQLTFGMTQSIRHNSIGNMRESIFSENRDNLHNALSRMSNLTSNQNIGRSRNSHFADRPQVTPPRVDISPQPNSGISPGNFSSLNTSQHTSQLGINRPPGFSSLHQQHQKNSQATINFNPQPPIRPSQATLSDPRPIQPNDTPFQSGTKRPAPFAAIYEDTPAIGKSSSPIMSRTRPSQAHPDIPRTSNISIGITPPPVINFAPSPQAPTPPRTQPDDPKAFNLEDFGSVRSEDNKLVESIIETHSNNQGSFAAERYYDGRTNLRKMDSKYDTPVVVPNLQRPSKSSSNVPSERNTRTITQIPIPVGVPVPMPESLPSPTPGFSQPNLRTTQSPLQRTINDPSLSLTEGFRQKKTSGVVSTDQRSTNSARQNLPPAPLQMEPDIPTLSSDAKASQNMAPTAQISRPAPASARFNQPTTQHIQIIEPVAVAQPPPLPDPKSAEYSHIIIQYEEMINQYRREITDLKAADGETRAKLEDLNTTIANLRADNVSLNTKLTSLKIDLENQETKHRNQVLKLKDDFKKNNDAKLVAIERSYSENLVKTRADYDQQIISLQQEISSLTMERRTLAEDKNQLKMEKQVQFMELSGKIEQLKQEAARIQVDIKVAKDKILTDLADKRMSNRSGGAPGGHNGMYNQLLAEKKKNMELTKQVLKLTNDALTNASNNPLHADRGMGEVSQAALDRLKRQLAEARTANHRISLAVMASLAKWQMDFGALLKTKVAAQTRKMLALESAKRSVEQENTNLRFENEISSSQLVLAQTGLKVANEELQVVKKELIEVKVINGNAPKSDLDVDLIRKYKRLEQENKQLVDYNKQIQEELLAAQEKALEKEGDSVPLKTHLTLLKKVEGERDELEQTNQNLMAELRELMGEAVGARKASHASGVRRAKKKEQVEVEYLEEISRVVDGGRVGAKSVFVGRELQIAASGAGSPPSNPPQNQPTKLTTGSALLKKTLDIVRDIKHYDKPGMAFGSLVNSIASANTDDLRVTAFNCTQPQYNLVKTSELVVSVTESIQWIRSVPEVTLEVTFRNLREGPIRFTELRIETESFQVRIEVGEDPSDFTVPSFQAKSIWFVLRFASGYFLELKPVWLLFKSSLELGAFLRPSSGQRQPLDGFHRFALPLTVNKLLESPVERIEKFSVLKTLKTMVNITLPIAGALRHERLAAIFPSVCSLNDEEGIFGVKVQSPQGMFFVTFLSKEQETLTILISSMFELKIFEELRETLEFIFRHAFI